MLNIKKMLTNILNNFGACQYSGADNTTINLTAGTMTHVPLNTSTRSINTNSALFELDTTNKGVRIKKAGTYKVQGSLYFSRVANSSVYAGGVFIRKASSGGSYSSATEIAGTVQATNTGNSGISMTVVGSPVIMSLSANDMLYLVARSTSSTADTSATVSAGHISTYLMVEKV